MQIPQPPLPEFLSGLDARLKKSTPSEVVKTLGQHVQIFPENAALTPQQRALLDSVLASIKRIVRNHGQTDETLIVELMTLGKLGHFDEALARGRRAFEMSQTWATAIAVGNALRRAGRMQAAAEMFAAAANLDKKDVTALLEVGDIELDAGHIPEALSAYEAALMREKSQAWAEPSAWYCRYLISGDEIWFEKLKKAAAKPVDHCGVENLLSEMFGGYSGEQRRARAKSLLTKLQRSA